MHNSFDVKMFFFQAGIKKINIHIKQIRNKKNILSNDNRIGSYISYMKYICVYYT